MWSGFRKTQFNIDLPEEVLSDHAAIEFIASGTRIFSWCICPRYFDNSVSGIFAQTHLYDPKSPKFDLWSSSYDDRNVRLIGYLVSIFSKEKDGPTIICIQHGYADFWELLGESLDIAGMQNKYIFQLDERKRSGIIVNTEVHKIKSVDVITCDRVRYGKIKQFYMPTVTLNKFTVASVHIHGHSKSNPKKDIATALGALKNIKTPLIAMGNWNTTAQLVKQHDIGKVWFSKPTFINKDYNAAQYDTVVTFGRLKCKLLPSPSVEYVKAIEAALWKKPA